MTVIVTIPMNLEDSLSRIGMVKSLTRLSRWLPRPFLKGSSKAIPQPTGVLSLKTRMLTLTSEGGEDAWHVSCIIQDG